MKIAIVTSGRLPVPATKGGAVETKLDYILDYNAEHHLHDITVYSVKPDKDIDKNTRENHYVNITLDSFWAKVGKKIYHYLNKTPYYNDIAEYFLYRCIRHMKGKQFDCIIIANRPGFVLKLREKIGGKLVNQINNDYISPDSPKASAIKEASSLIITCSDFLNRQTSKVACQANTPIVTVHNGIDIKRFAEAKPIDRAVLGMSKGDFIVFFSGRLTKEKGILELIQAVKQIKTIPNLKLIIAGASFYGKDSPQTPYIQELQREAEEIKEQVVFFQIHNTSDNLTIGINNCSVRQSMSDDFSVFVHNIAVTKNTTNHIAVFIHNNTTFQDTTDDITVMIDDRSIKQSTSDGNTI